MTRSKGQKRLTIGSRAVAVAIVAEAIRAVAHSGSPIGDDITMYAHELADEFVELAWDVEYKPTAERLVITIDAGVTGSDKMRSTPEDAPPRTGDDVRDIPRTP